MSVFSAYPRCVIEVYPWEGGQYEIQGGDILSCVVGKSVDGSSGGFSIRLAPNGIGASNRRGPDWTQVITPMSFIIIGMQRYAYSQIVLVGVVTAVTTQQDWTHQGTVIRTVELRGQDFSRFFDSFNWSVLSFSAVFGLQAYGEGLTGNGNAGIPASQGLLGGASASDSNPAIIGQKWYSQIMAGDNGILAKTNMAYQGGRVTFNSSVSTVFETYPDVFIPTYDNFLSAQGSWTSKFKAIFPWPWYEFFVITAPLTYYGTGSFTGKPYTMRALPGAAAAGPVLVARVNPQPRLIAKSKGAGVPFELNGIDSKRWDELELSLLDNHGSINSVIGFSADEVRNAYTLNPIQMRALFGDNNGNSNIFFYSFSGAIDVASIHRYGYHPEVTSTEWFSDPTGSAGANKELDIPQTLATLLCQVISQYQPTPLMAVGSVVIPLRPDILPGTRFQYSPFRGDEPWVFYINTVEHTYEFGAASFTTLTLSRGLPASIYVDFSQKGVFYACMTGTAERQEGEYAIRTATKNDVGLTIYGAQPDQIAALAASIAKAFANPQTP